MSAKLILHHIFPNRSLYIQSPISSPSLPILVTSWVSCSTHEVHHSLIVAHCEVGISIQPVQLHGHVHQDCHGQANHEQVASITLHSQGNQLDVVWSTSDKMVILAFDQSSCATALVNNSGSQELVSIHIMGCRQPLTPTILGSCPADCKMSMLTATSTVLYAIRLMSHNGCIFTTLSAGISCLRACCCSAVLKQKKSTAC